MQTEFNYKAINKKGKVVGGVRHALNELELNRQLRAEDLNLIHAEPLNKFSVQFLMKKLNSSFGSVSTHEKIIVYRNIGSMLSAGLALSKVLSILSRQTKNPNLKRVINNIEEEVRKGSSLSGAMKKFPNVFSELAVSMVLSGEESGNLVESLYVTADQMEKSYVLKKKIQGALVYPGVIICAMLIIGIFMMIYIVPTLTKTFSELKIDLPQSTQFIINLSDFFQNNLFLSLTLLLILILGIFLGMKNPLGKKMFDWLILKIPVVSDLVKEINSARTARTLASLLKAGVPFIRATQIVQDVVQNYFYKEVLKKAEKNIQLGLPMSKVFIEAEKYYPVFVGEMVSVGEETGELAPMLLKVAEFYEQEVEDKTKNLSTIVEPVLMIVVGIAVGFFAISMITPMYSLVDTL